jgi:hypothetical protein
LVKIKRKMKRQFQIEHVSTLFISPSFFRYILLGKSNVEKGLTLP